MSSISTSETILLTGGTGFVGSTVLANLLEKGFAVRAVVRSTAKAAPLMAKFQPYVDSGKLTFTIVPDIMVSGAFESALSNIAGVIHCASPLPSNDPNADPQELIGPAVRGTIGILQDAAKAPTVKRVVVASSLVTLLEPAEGKYVYTEADWFDSAPKWVEQQGRDAPGGLKYMASKVLAERAAWEWIRQNKPSFELVTVLPPWVWGKSILLDEGHIRPESSNYRLLSALSRAGNAEFDLFETTDFADVLDIAEGHVKALTTPGIAGERFLLVSKSITWQEALDILAANPVNGLVLPTGTPGSAKDFVSEKFASGEKAKKQLSMTYRSPRDTLHDAVAQAVELGWKL